MKIVCEHCGAGYSVADEKIAGRALKLRCKKCSEVIRIDGRKTGEQSEAADTEATPDYGPDPFAEAGSEPAATVGDEAAIWHIAVGDTTQGPYTLDELATYYTQGSVVLDTLVFRDGWPEWRPAGEVPELTDRARAGFSAAPGSASDKPATADLLQPVPMGDDPFAERVQVPTPRVSAEQMLAKGPGHEGTVQFSLDEIKAISAVSVPSTLPGVSLAPATTGTPRAGYASGEGSGLIDMRALSQMAATPPADSESAELDDSGLSPLDSLLPLSLPSTPPADDRAFRMKLFAGVAAFAMLLAAGVGALAIVYQGQPVAAPLPADALPQAAPVATAAAAIAAPAEEEAEEELAEPAAEAAAEEDEGAAEPERASAPKRSTERVAKRDAKPKAKRKDSSAKPRKAKGTDIEDVLVEKPKSEPRKAKGGDALDDLLLGAISAKKSEPKPERKPAAQSGLPQSPSRDAIGASLAKAAAKAKRCPGSGVATAEITIKGSSGRASKVTVGGVTGASKSCVEKAVRSTPFPKFQKDVFQVKYPFRLAG